MADVQLLNQTNDLSSVEILVKCIEWLTNETKMAHPICFFAIRGDYFNLLWI
jgi:hypothetical protein